MSLEEGFESLPVRVHSLYFILWLQMRAFCFLPACPLLAAMCPCHGGTIAQINSFVCLGHCVLSQQQKVAKTMTMEILEAGPEFENAVYRVADLPTLSL